MLCALLCLQRHLNVFDSLSQHWFRDFPDVKHTLSRWKEEYNNDRPHSSLGLETPARFRTGFLETKDQNQPEDSRV